jgi:hypothetical protein
MKPGKMWGSSAGMTGRTAEASPVNRRRANYSGHIDTGQIEIADPDLRVLARPEQDPRASRWRRKRHCGRQAQCKWASRIEKPAGALMSAAQQSSSLRSVGAGYRVSVVVPLPPQPPGMARQPLLCAFAPVCRCMTQILNYRTIPRSEMSLFPGENSRRAACRGIAVRDMSDAELMCLQDIGRESVSYLRKTLGLSNSAL